MKFTKVTFTHPVIVFSSDGSVGMLSTLPNQSGRVVDSIEARGHWLVVVRGGEVKAVPASKVEAGDVLELDAQAETGELPRRGPGRPTNAERAASLSRGDS